MLVALPEELGAETDEDAAELEAARERGYYVGAMPIRMLMEIVRERGHHPETVAGILRQLSGSALEGHIHVLEALDGCVVAISTRGNPALVAARDLETVATQRHDALMALAEPAVLRLAGEAPQRAGSVSLISAPDDPVVSYLHGESEVVRAATYVADVYVRRHEAAEAIAALPLKNLGRDNALRATRRLMAPIPAGSIRAVILHEGEAVSCGVTSCSGPRGGLPCVAAIPRFTNHLKHLCLPPKKSLWAGHTKRI